MLEETHRLTRLVDALLTISRADAGQIDLQRAPKADSRRRRQRPNRRRPRGRIDLVERSEIASGLH
jgi:signal transduction histidine kinase